MRLLTHCLLLLVSICLLAVSDFGQTATGDIVGRVTDVQGAVIVGATVTAKSTTTGFSRNGVSNSAGDYELTGMPPGDYEISAATPNMAKGVATVKLLLGAHQTVNFSLKPAAVGTVLEVTGEAAQIETSASELRENIDTKQITELPLRDRNFASLATLAPNVSPVGSFDPTKLRTGNVSINGSTGRSMNLTVDGGDNKDNVVGGFLQNYTTEGIQEFVVDTHRFGADTGKSAGGVVAIATKAGTNTLHGSAFGFMRNRNIQAADFFTKNPNQTDPQTGNPVPCPPCFVGPSNPKPPFDKRNYGGSLGGPLIKDKLYFFGAGELAHENTSISQVGTTPDSIQAFIDLRNAHPLADSILQNAPLSTAPSVAVPYRDSQWQVRMDYNLSAKHHFFARYAQQNNHVTGDQITGTSDPNEGAAQINDLHSILGNWSWSLSPKVLNTLVFQYATFFNSIQAQPGSAGIPNVFFANNTDFGQNGNVPQTTEQKKVQVRDDVSWQMGKHSVKFGFMEVAVPKFGGEFAFVQTPEIFLFCDPQEIRDSGTCGSVTATSLDNPGVVKRTILAGGEPFFFQDTIHQVSYYVQDDWRITPRLTLNLGVRNDIDFGLVPTTTQINNRAIKVLKAIGEDPGLPKTDTNNWAPRAGFAWDVMGTGKWLLRGGYGMFFDQLFQNVTLFAVQAANPNVYSTLFDVRTPNSSSGIGLSQAVAAVGTYPVSTLPDLPYGARGRFIDPRFQNPFAEHATLGTQIQLAQNLVLSVDLIHVLSLHEFNQRELNPAVDGSNDSRIMNAPDGSGFYPGSPGMDAIFGCANVFGTQIPCGSTDPVTGAAARHRLHRISEAQSSSRSRYDSLSVELKRRFANRFQLGATYVLSRALTYGGFASDFGSINQGVSAGRTPTESALIGIIQPQNFGYASEDHRHRFVFNGITELPGGFVVSGIVQLESARPYNMFADDDINGDGTAFSDLYSPIVTGDPVFDPIGEGDVRFAVHPNQLRGDPYYQTDLRVQKNFSIGERWKIQLIADLFNVFNRTNFGNAFQNLSDGFDAQQPDVPVLTGASGPALKDLPRKPVGLFGGGFGGAGTVGIPFQAQFGLRIQF